MSGVASSDGIEIRSISDCPCVGPCTNCRPGCQFFSPRLHIKRVPDFIKAGADIVSVHCEQQAAIHLHWTVNQVEGLVLDHDSRHPGMIRRDENCYILTCNVYLEYDKRN